VFRDRLSYLDLRGMVVALAARHAVTTILIERAGPRLNLLQDLREDLLPVLTYPIGIKPEGSKADRMAAQSAKDPSWPRAFAQVCRLA